MNSATGTTEKTQQAKCIDFMRQLQDGYLNISDFVKTGANTLQSLKVLPKLKPFDGVKAEELRNTVEMLFTEQIGQEICACFSAKARLSLLPQDEIAAGMAERIKHTTDFSATEERIA